MAEASSCVEGARVRTTIDANGACGYDGLKYATVNNSSAWRGCNGKNGQNASAPSCGMPGANISLMLSAGMDGIHVQGLNGWEAFTCEVPKDQNLFVTCIGGAGGDGGWGEGGQNGGRGTAGSDATQYSDGGNGHRGGNGGSAGAGTDGARGGDGGHIEISVKEDDMDLLIALEWAVEGGVGGQHGIHGQPGSGGEGGPGGAGCSWTEQRGGTDAYGNQFSTTTHHSRPGGHSGSPGKPGKTPWNHLVDGEDGQVGSCEFIVYHNDGSTVRYASRYELRLQTLELQDENCDGINEPGEHLIAKRIIVRNHGEMPSPSRSPIPLVFRESFWIDPKDQLEYEPALISASVPGFACMDITGVVTALIRPEIVQRQNPYQALQAVDQLEICAIFSRLGRSIPWFHVPMPIIVRYPLELINPVYLETVSLGEQFTIQWTIVNVSKRIYGIDSSLHRTCATRIWTEKTYFSLQDQQSAEELLIPLRIINPGVKIQFTQKFQARTDIEPFSEDFIRLQLMLSPPSNVKGVLDAPSSLNAIIHPVCHYRLKVQLSPRFQCRESSSFLLVVNTDVPKSLIDILTSFIQSALHLDLDIFNISLEGSFNRQPNINVLSLYARKSIIVLCNPFMYFGTPSRAAYEFMDPRLVSQLCKWSTAFLLLGLRTTNEVTEYWGQMISTPMFPIDIDGTDGSLHGRTPKKFLSLLPEKYVTQPLATEYKTHSVLVKKKMFRTRARSVELGAKKLSKKLTVRCPFQKFVLMPISPDTSHSTPLTLAVQEQIPFSARVFLSTVDCKKMDTALSRDLQYLITASLPFEWRARKFWEGVNPKARNLLVEVPTWDKELSPEVTSCASEPTSPSQLPFSLFTNEPIPQVDNRPASNIANEKATSKTNDERGIRQLVYLSTLYDVLLPLVKYVMLSSRFSFSDPLPKTPITISSYIPNLSTFFSIAIQDLSDTSISVVESIEDLAMFFATLQGSVKSNPFSKGRGRKKFLNSHIQAQIENTLNAHFNPSIREALRKELKKSLRAHKKALKSIKKGGQKTRGIPSSVAALVQRINTTVGFEGVTECVFYDLAAGIYGLYGRETGSENVCWTEEQAQTMIGMHEEFSARLRSDEQRSSELRRELLGHSQVNGQ